MKKTALILGIFFFSFSVSRAQGDVQSLLDAGKRLEEQLNEPDALKQYMKVLDLDPANYTALWHTSFLLSKIGHRESDKEIKVKYFKQAKSYAEKAVASRTDDAEGFFSLAVALGRYALIANAKERVAASRDIKENSDRALALNPTHAGAWHVLGLWNFRVANLSMIERGAANLLFGGVPEGASNEESEKCYQKAIQLDPGNILYYYDLARLYDKMDKEEEAKNTLKKALALRPVTPDDPANLKLCKELLEDL